MLGHARDSESVLGVGQKKLIHKTSEQKRRDCLKAGYEDLRTVLYDCDGGTSKADILRLGKRPRPCHFPFSKLKNAAPPPPPTHTVAYEQLKSLRKRVRELEGGQSPEFQERGPSKQANSDGFSEEDE